MKIRTFKNYSSIMFTKIGHVNNKKQKHKALLKVYWCREPLNGVSNISKFK